MEFLIIISVAIGILIWRDQAKQKAALKAQRMDEILNIVAKAQSTCEKIETLKTNAAKVNNCEKALSQLHQLDAYAEARNVVTNLDELIQRLEALKKVLPVIGHVEKAYKYQFKGNDKSEKNALLDALYDIQTNEVTDEDFFNAQAFPEGTGEIVQRAGIEERLRKLGWQQS